MMDDLIAFIRRCLDDDERVARGATQGDWRWGYPGGPAKFALMAGQEIVVPSRTPDVYPSRHDAEHIVRWDPARVLALTAAVRRILDEFSWEAREVLIVQELAEALYADRDGYRAEWKP